MSIDDDHPHAIDERDIKALQAIKRAGEDDDPYPDDDAPEDRSHRAATERKPGLPSDLACSDCGGVIEHGDPCIATTRTPSERSTTRTVNEYGEALPDGNDSVHCVDCAGGSVKASR